jgi:hypothetical protein
LPVGYEARVPRPGLREQPSYDAPQGTSHVLTHYSFLAGIGSDGRGLAARMLPWQASPMERWA